MCVCVCVCEQSFARNRSRRTEVYLLPSVKVSRLHTHTIAVHINYNMYRCLYFSRVGTCLPACAREYVRKDRVSLECLLTHLGTYVENNEQ